MCALSCVAQLYAVCTHSASGAQALRQFFVLCVAAVVAQPALLWCHWLPVVKYLRKWEPHWTLNTVHVVFISCEAWSSVVLFGLFYLFISSNYFNYDRPLRSFNSPPLCSWACLWLVTPTCFVCFDRGQHLWVSSLSRTSETPCLLSGDATCLHKGGNITSTPQATVRASEMKTHFEEIVPEHNSP